MNMEYIGDIQESVNIRCIQRRESVTAIFSQISCLQQNFSKNHFPISCQLCTTHVKETNKIIKESENIDNSVIWNILKYLKQKYYLKKK